MAEIRPILPVDYHGVKRPNAFDLPTTRLFRSVLSIQPGRMVGCVQSYFLNLAQPLKEDLRGHPTSPADIGAHIQATHPRVSGGDKGRMFTLEDAFLRQASVTLHINEQGYYLFELDDTGGPWHFDLQNLGVTAKAAYSRGLDTIAYFDRHGTEIDIPDASYDFGQTVNKGETCRNVVVAVRGLDQDKHFSLNLHVILVSETGETLPTIFDPDIKNDGLGFGGGGGGG